MDELSEDGYRLAKNLRQRRTAEETSLIGSKAAAPKNSEAEVNMLCSAHNTLVVLVYAAI